MTLAALTQLPYNKFDESKRALKNITELLKNTAYNLFLHKKSGERFKNLQAELFSHAEILNRSALVSVSDLKGNIIDANELFCSTSKYSLEEIIFKPHSIIRHPDTPNSLFKEMWSTIGKGLVWQGELKNRAKDGSTYWVMATVAPVMGSNGKPEKYISVRYNITSQKQTELELSLVKQKVDTDLFHNVTYAKQIHKSFLCNNEGLNLRPDSFLIYRAQKIISGDFYKIERKDNKLMIAIGDSTGHGVSASYISILALNILTRALQFCHEDPVKIMTTINKELNRITHLNKEKPLIETSDMIICCIDNEKMQLNYASANMRALIIRNKETILLEKDKCSIGERHEDEFKITNQTFEIQKGDRLYILSDGLHDQIGGLKNKCFGFKNVTSLLKKSSYCSMNEQKIIIEEALNSWQGTNEQTDDITLFGIQI